MNLAKKRLRNTLILTGTAVYPHMPILHPHATRFHEWCISCAFGLRAHWTINRTSPILGFRGATFPKMGDSLPRMPINRRVKFVASAEKSVTVQTHKITNKQVRSSLGTAVYPHMPRANIADRRQSPLLMPSVEGTGVYRQYLPPHANSSDFGFWASKVPQNGRFHSQDAHEPSHRIWHC